MTTETKFWYGRVDPGYESRYEATAYGRLDITDEHDQVSMAEEAADDYHSNHDGWEASWPITIGIFADGDDGPEVARFEVEREARPEFHASRIAGVPGDGKTVDGGE